jgi:hypothetical protein
MKLSFWKKLEKNAIIDTFTDLGNKAREGFLSYEEFKNEWKKKTDEYRAQGCIKGAYWHVRETTGNFVDYSPK